MCDRQLRYVVLACLPSGGRILLLMVVRYMYAHSSANGRGIRGRVFRSWGLVLRVPFYVCRLLSTFTALTRVWLPSPPAHCSRARAVVCPFLNAVQRRVQLRPGGLHARILVQQHRNQPLCRGYVFYRRWSKERRRVRGDTVRSSRNLLPCRLVIIGQLYCWVLLPYE